MESVPLETGATHGRADWERLAAAVLRKSGRLADDAPDADVWARLTRRTLDGIAIPPLGTPDLLSGLVSSGRPTRNGDWDIRPVHADPDATATKQAVLADLENGATSVWLQVGEHGLALADLVTVLEPVLLDLAPVILEAPGDQLEVAQAFATLARGTQLADGTNLGVDPVGAAIRTGGFSAAMSSRHTHGLVEPAGRLATELGCLAVVVDGTVVHDLGASDVQELGYVAAVGAGYLRELVEAGHDVDAAASLIEFRLAATDEQFPTIAKLRAARRLWARVLELSGAGTGSMRLHAVTSRPMMSRYDPWVNMLRTCVATFAAGVGGADAVTVLPFDAPIGLPDNASRRIARNTSSLLVAESHVGAVADPAGGSHLVEKLTDDLAVAGWAELGLLETAASGDEHGSLAGLAGLEDRIGAVVAERDRQVATRKRPLTGLSEFPNLHESLPERTPYAGGGLPVKPYGHAFEELRAAPVEPKVYLATMASVAAHTARATFATNLLAAGGIDVVNEGAHDDVDAVLAHYNGEPVVCLVGADAAYAEWGTPLAEALRAAGARWVVVAGKPLEGCDDNCAAGVDALEFLTRTREQLR
ncbi:methylmalonyl-CoA mutase family protein [Nocardioides terrisoli]|uniref:methylmalonyl-CoA mutase family protein n=1 Tax=Nocardioides terrisoli TaxID=3388267 RepID=UPI00287B6321|nr:methylmalonyl-CoA mutase family protein [Nocardioides marmorisolisilvae]